MSLISEALNKVQIQQSASGVAYSSYSNHPHARRHQPVVRVKSLTFIWANAAVLALFFVAGLIYLRSERNSGSTKPVATTAEMSPAPVNTTPAVADVAPASTPSALSTTSPAAARSIEPEPASLTPAPAVAVSNDYDLAGMSALGNSTLLSISRRSDRRSVWVQVGKSVGEISAVSYDPETDSAKIAVNGRLMTIKMRDGGPASIAAE